MNTAQNTIHHRKIEIIVAVWIDEDANVQDVVADLHYQFEHPASRILTPHLQLR